MSFANRFRRKKKVQTKRAVPLTVDNSRVAPLFVEDPAPFNAQNWDYISPTSTAETPVTTPESYTPPEALVCAPRETPTHYPSDHVTVCEPSPSPSYDHSPSYDSGSSYSSSDSGGGGYSGGGE